MIRSVMVYLLSAAIRQAVLLFLSEPSPDHFWL
nr:MAG TPA: hypothetical protein [Caudoviricetes sp.]